MNLIKYYQTQILVNLFRLLNRLADLIQKEYEPTEKELFNQKNLITDLQQFILNYVPRSTVELMRPSIHSSSGKSPVLEIFIMGGCEGEDLQVLAEGLRTRAGIVRVDSALTSRVPMIKFYHRYLKVE